MGTVATLALPAAKAADLPAAKAAVAEVFSRVEREMSLFRAGSDVSRLNAAAGAGAVAVGAGTAAVLDYALRVARESGGAFDPAVGPLMRLWGFRDVAPPAATPSPGEIAAALALSGWTNVWLAPAAAGEETREAALRLPGASLDLGGIAKGHAVDLAWERLRQAGHDDFLVNLGGNMRGRGNPAPRRRGWRVAVQDPFDRRSWAGTLTLRDGEAVATSGGYERFVTIGARRVPHILDPRTGRPPAAGVASVSVLAPSAMEADALSTALFVLGPAEGRRLLAAHPGCEAIYVMDNEPADVLLTAGLAGRFRPAACWRGGIAVLPAD